MDIDAASAYAERHEMHALLVQRGDELLLERYANGYSAEKPHWLYSGTKSFWGIAAIEAQREGIFCLDDIVVATATARMLLQMTAGYGFGGLGNAVPTYDKAFSAPLKTMPGETFTYSGIPLQVFGGFFASRLQRTGMAPHDYLQARVLERAGVNVAEWRTLRDGTHPLPTGARMTARDWLRYGRYLMREYDEYAEAFQGSKANPRYGLCWWLAAPGMPAGLFYASGSGGQALYVVPSHDIVVVHFGNGPGYKHEAFLKRLFV